MGLTALSLALADRAMAQLSDTSYRLVFAEEFNGATVDTAKWAVASPTWTMPNSASTASASQVRVGNGALTLDATRLTTGASFSSGSISSYGKYTLDGGYIEARIKLPTTPGSWPAFWGLYTGWPPEADIMEFPLTTDGGTNGYTNNFYHTAFHYTNSSGAAAAGAGQVNPSSATDLTTGYHIFAMDWVSDTSVKFYFDGVQVSSFTSGADVAEMANMYMILDYAVGGWPGTPSTTQWPVGFMDQTSVDWVRVWQKNPNSDAASTWNINGNGTFTTAANWSGGGVPKYGNQVAVFGRVGAAATSTITMPAWTVMGGVTFNGGGDGTTAYTLGSSTNSIQLAGQPLGSTTNGSTVQASSTSTVNQTINARVELWSGTTFRNDMTGGPTLNFNGELSGGGALTVTGVGATVLNAAGIYTGTASVGAAAEVATLRLSANNALGTGGVIIGPSGNATTARLELTGGITQLSSIDFRGRNNSSVGIQNLSGNNTLAGVISASAGGSVYQIQSDAGLLTLNGGLQAAAGQRTFTLQGAGNGTVDGPIQNGGGTVSLIKDGAGVWTVANSSTYTGSTTINSGTLRLGSISPVARYTFDDVSGSTVVNGGSGGVTMNGTLASGAAIVAGGRFGNAVSLTGGASVNINNPVIAMGNTGVWTMSAWVKTTTAGSSILTKSNGSGWASGNTVFYLGDGVSAGSGGIPSAVRWGGGFLQVSSNATSVIDGNWHMVTYVNSGGIYSIYVDGVAQSLSSGNSSFSNTDVGAIVRLGVTTSNSDGTTNFNGLLDDVQFYSQALSPAQIAAIYQGQAIVGSLPSTTNLTIASGATLDLNGMSQTFSAVNSAVGSEIALGNGQLTFNSAAGIQIPGTISGVGGSVVKEGAGTLTLAGANTYSGTTALNAGTLIVTGTLAEGGTMTTATGTVLTGTGVVNASTTVNGTHSPGGSVGIQTFGTLTYGSTARFVWELGGNLETPGSFDKVTASGAATIGAGAFVEVVLNGSGSSVAFNDAFWGQPRSWPFLTASSVTGTFALGSITADPAGRALSNYGTLTLRHDSTAVALVFTPYTPEQNWQREMFGADWSNPTVAGEMVDGDRDGLPNLFEYFVRSDPRTSSLAARPLVTAIEGRLTITFTRNTVATDVTASVFAADNLSGPWTELARSTGGSAFSVLAPGAAVSETGNGSTRSVQVSDLYLASDPAHPRRFLKLEVQH